MENYLNFKNEIDENKLRKMAEKIRDGEIVVFPTDTVYGIGVNCLDKEAINKLYEVKNRPKEKPICLLVSSIEMIKTVAKDINDIEYEIMEKFFPGPLTIILNKKDIIPDELTAWGDTIGIRIPDNKIAQKLIEFSEVPIATSSANITGKLSGTNIKQIKKDFEGKVENYIDGGESKIGVPSTIVQVVNGQVKILREGEIKKEEIENAIKTED